MSNNEISGTIERVSDYEEAIRRIKQLFKYQLPSETKDCPRPVFIEVGGGSGHTKIYFDDRSEADKVEDFFVEMLEKRIKSKKKKLFELCSNYVKEHQTEKAGV